jgi:hypothetical protein
LAAAVVGVHVGVIRVVVLRGIGGGVVAVFDACVRAAVVAHVCLAGDFVVAPVRTADG